MKIFYWLIEKIMPPYKNYKVNNELTKKSDALVEHSDLQGEFCEFCNEETIGNTTSDELELLNQKEFERKKSLEDKAKTNIISVTIAITLIMGANNLCENIYTKFQFCVLHWLAFSLFVFAVLYMIIAGIISIRLISHLNIFFFTSNQEASLSNVDEIKEINICIGKNRIWNLMRNNNIYTAYECIRNSLICLLIVLIISIIPFTQNLHTLSHESNIEYFYSSDVAEYVTNSEIQDEIIADVDKFIESIGELDDKTNNIYGFINEDASLYIKLRAEEDTVYILNVEPITSQ